ncbi:hypothetical protein AM1_F0032 (plasmid) [Acaryochloris marina MBIC11017]|uniref:Uncharacterized protein n=1 Tax=Acaryochloris marina (strain MBIC 11017) TaxID=329726 RepID=A8ZQ16_ACAM1|nr:hypothetical protein AM1_F0032 [Acaryochloris marina MBIC11017]
MGVGQRLSCDEYLDAATALLGWKPAYDQPDPQKLVSRHMTNFKRNIAQ